MLKVSVGQNLINIKEKQTSQKKKKQQVILDFTAAVLTE